MTTPKKKFSFWRGFWKLVYFFIGLMVCAGLLAAVTLYTTWKKLPELQAMTNYRPAIPLRIYSNDGILLAEYGEERREYLSFNEIPQVMKDALLAAEDGGFYEHGGVDWIGVGRAVLANLISGAKMQGASTITMQVARNFYLSSKKTYTRKLYEVLMTYKIESELSKDQILELYMNQIYLGHRAYGFGAASQIYFGVPLEKVTLAQAAILAGIPKAPSRINPISNLKEAKERQAYVLGRMLKLGKITQAQYDQARAEPIVLSKDREKENEDGSINASKQGRYVAELARRLMYEIYKEDVYSRGLSVYLTVDSKDQDLAYQAVRDAVLAYTARRPYPGPEAQWDLPVGIEKNTQAFSSILSKMKTEYPDDDDLLAYIVLSADAKQVVATRSLGQSVTLTGKSLDYVKRALVAGANKKLKIDRGSVIYVQKLADGQLKIINKPTVEAAFVALDPSNGAIRAMVGGFDYEGSFNRVTQAWRQPGSTFKPFLYAAALERGVTPQTIVSDEPFYMVTPQHTIWMPKNYGNKYDGQLTLRRGLYMSKNMVSIRTLQVVGPDFATDFISRFGFDPNKQPPKGAYLTMALGSGSVTPLQMATGFSVFANGGYRIQPYLINRVVDSTNNVLMMQANPDRAGDENNRVIDARTAYVMQDLLRGVATHGTAARVRGELKRSDIAGKTGTTNNSLDAWFVGFNSKLVGAAWLGYDNPKPLGERETGGGSAMPIFITFMKGALAGVPEDTVKSPPIGLTKDGENFWYREFPPGKYIAMIQAGDSIPPQELRDEKARQDYLRRKNKTGLSSSVITVKPGNNPFSNQRIDSNDDDLDE
ncbi:penicillin-binding protein 1A [Basilea psittacipulmonis]|uniref:penicillin-binding protein 1A n=1 Tax=Basilea psittacipulmonis TaxID=1472345 RepID=UPI00068DA7A8|nr:PBP1A family penicillin-binding protein [Basilea psittacipulmonis]